MPTHLPCLRVFAATALLLAATVHAQSVYRCGNSYGPAPCAGGQVVAVDDARTADQRQQALTAKKQDAQLAGQLAAERRAREQAAAGQQAARIGPSQAEVAHADAAQAKARAKAEAQRNKANKPRRLSSA